MTIKPAISEYRSKVCTDTTRDSSSTLFLKQGTDKDTGTASEGTNQGAASVAD